MSNFFERLREERERLGVDQEQMAKAGGVGKRTYCYYEAGERNPDSEFLAAISAAGADVLYILTGQRTALVAAEPAGTYEVVSKKEAALLNHYRHLSAEDQRAIERTTDALAQSYRVKSSRGKAA